MWHVFWFPLCVKKLERGSLYKTWVLRSGSKRNRPKWFPEIQIWFDSDPVLLTTSVCSHCCSHSHLFSGQYKPIYCWKVSETLHKGNWHLLTGCQEWSDAPHPFKQELQALFHQWQTASCPSSWWRAQTQIQTHVLQTLTYVGVQSSLKLCCLPRQARVEIRDEGVWIARSSSLPGQDVIAGLNLEPMISWH